MATPAMGPQDPAVVDSKHYKVEFENERVRVLRITYGPHEKSVMHGHPDGIAIALTEARVRFTFPDGKAEERTMKAGEAFWSGAEEHLPENLGDGRLEVIQVELKG